ncbi:MAG: proton-conducting transporter membrane subunit [Marinoscillum sp.]
MLYSILGVFLFSLISNLFYKKREGLAIAIISISLLGLILYFGSFIPDIIAGKTIYQHTPWIDTLNIHCSFYLDGLSLFFALLISIFGLLVFLYSSRYMKAYEQRNRFFSFLFLFMGSMLGVVLSANAISLFVFWELTSFSSFLLIGFNHDKQESRRAARQAMLVTAGGGLALMSGLVLLELMTSTGFNLNEAIKMAAAVESNDLKVAAILLIGIGAFTKSAQFPFHFWLPNAMAAPTPVSAYLHSATMVKTGVYLVLRLNPVFGQVELWANLLGIVGAISMTWGAVKAFRQDDFKSVLAYTTISALGIFFMMTGVGSESAINAVMVYIFAHALYKGALFLAAGNIDHQTGTRSISALSDLFRKMPYTSIIVLCSFASMAGIIPFIGFIGKESLYDALFHDTNDLAVLYLILLFISSAFFVAITLDITFEDIFKRGNFRHQAVKEASWWMVVPPILMVLVSLVSGIMPGTFIEPLIQWSAANILGAEPSMHLKLWHGFNTILALSLATLASGVGLFLLRKTIRKYDQPQWLYGDYWYDHLMSGITSVSKRVTNFIQNGYLRNYIALILLVFCSLMAWVLIHYRAFSTINFSQLGKDAEIYELVILAFISIAVAFLFRTRSRLTVTATFGIIGYSIALAYTLFSAPDVAITQFLAETLTLMMMILILHKLPSYTLKKRINHWKYLPISIVFGLIMTGVSYIMLEQESHSPLKQYFLEQSVKSGKGENAVNVILVDFRALDTLGEITVLAITMIGIVGLLAFKTKKI